MAHRHSLKYGLMACVLMSTSSLARQAVPDGYQRVARAHGVPAEALYSIALAESARRLPMGERPWPWTINVAGKGYRYHTRFEAWQALQTFIQQHPLKRIDVGIGQINLGWHGHRFTSDWEAFEPYTNLNTAAAILRECYDQRPGSWLDAAGCYHHPAGGMPARRYKDIVNRQLNALRGSEVASAGYIWDEPGSKDD